jgi:uncharacterized membrane protein YtjA (UPF0391 family)
MVTRLISAVYPLSQERRSDRIKWITRSIIVVNKKWNDRSIFWTLNHTECNQSCASGLNCRPGAVFALAPDPRSFAVLYYALVFLVIALVAGVFGFGGISIAATGIAKTLFLIFLILFLVSAVFGIRTRGR